MARATLSEIERSLDSLTALREREIVDKKTGRTDVAAFERDVLAAAHDVARGLIAEAMARADVTAAAIEVEGATLRRVLRSPQTYMTAAGEVVVERWLYADRSGDDTARAISPLEKRLGIVAGFWTPEAARRGLWLVAQMTPGKAVEALDRVGTLQPSKASLDRLPKVVSDRWEADRERFETALRAGLVIPAAAVTVAASLDGVLAPMDGADPYAQRQAAEAGGYLAKGPAGYREVGCATLSFCDAAGDMIAAIRFARAPETKKATLKAQLVAELGAVLQTRPDLRLVKVADAGADNWEFLARALPPGDEVVDFFHASEHLHAAVAAAYGDGTRQTRVRHEELADRLRDDDDGVEVVLRALGYLRRKHPGRAVIGRELAYFRTHRARMRYAALKAQGLPIGSGVVEAACKTLVTQRLKLSGMRWSAKGAQAILTTRGWDQSERFEEAWALLAATYQADIHILAKVVPLKPPSR
jgi:hypothetical protein